FATKTSSGHVYKRCSGHKEHGIEKLLTLQKATAAQVGGLINGEIKIIRNIGGRQRHQSGH
ncbi:hypothetical protein, partial [Pseudomonas savastanoi]|uniref:hypothetical protein n=1 Tax=Pseudomonas savastanoi TaxID=29438 RepID=UPI001C81060D